MGQPWPKPNLNPRTRTHVAGARTAAAARIGSALGGTPVRDSDRQGEAVSASMQAGWVRPWVRLSGVRCSGWRGQPEAARSGRTGVHLGHRIVLGAGESPAAADLLGHEDAHVLQQRERRVAQITPTARHALEAEAGQAGTRLLQGRT